MRCLVVGGGGPVGVGLLYLLKQLNASCTVVDPKLPRHMGLHREKLGGTLTEWIAQPYTLADLEAHLKREKFDVVVDLAPTFDKRLSIGVCDALGVSLVNSTMVDFKDDIHIAAYNFVDNRPTATKRAHMVASGMNPGAANAMAEELIKQFGVPDEIAFWEYDNSAPQDGVWRNSATTWCQGESHDELTNDYNFEVLEEGTILLHEDSLGWDAQNFMNLGIPFDTVPVPAEGEAFLVGHEECVYLGWRHDTAAKFIYGLHPENMAWIRRAGYDGKPDLLVCEPGKVIRGRDIMGVSCRYDDTGEWEGAYCMLENTAETPMDTNATCILVAAGVAASVKLLAEGNVEPGVYLTHELDGFMPAFRTFATVHRCTVKKKVPAADEANKKHVSKVVERPLQ
jgi:hypothetical protein